MGLVREGMEWGGIDAGETGNGWRIGCDDDEEVKWDVQRVFDLQNRSKENRRACCICCPVEMLVIDHAWSANKKSTRIMCLFEVDEICPARIAMSICLMNLYLI